MQIALRQRLRIWLRDRDIPAQQLQQNFLIEQVLKLIAKSSIKIHSL